LENNLTPLEELKRRFAEARDMTQEARREAEIDQDYRDGYQWTPTERRALALRKQPDQGSAVHRRQVEFPQHPYGCGR
jgi:hypothetical protein